MRNQPDATVRHRLAILATHPIQYQCPLWARLAQYQRLAIKVFYASDFSVRGYNDRGFDTRVAWSKHLLEGYEYHFAGQAAWHPVFLRGCRSLEKALAAFQPTDMLLNAYLPIFYWQAWNWAIKNRVRLHFRGDTTDSDRLRGTFPTMIRDCALQLFYSKIETFYAVGKNSRTHYVRRGIPPCRIVDSPFCVDTDAFDALRSLHDRRRDEYRANWNLADDDFVLVFSGKLIAKKDPIAAIAAVGGLQAIGGRTVKLLIMGDGPMRTECEAAARSVCGDRVTFLGFKSQADLAVAYVAADALVMPSTRSETWGLVVNEALQFGLPCIVSDRVGCANDLITIGETGESFVHGDIAGLRAAITRLVTWQTGRRNAVARRCRKAVSRFSLDAAAEGILLGVTRT